MLAEVADKLVALSETAEVSTAWQDAVRSTQLGDMLCCLADILLMYVAGVHDIPESVCSQPMRLRIAAAVKLPALPGARACIRIGNASLPFRHRLADSMVKCMAATIRTDQLSRQEVLSLVPEADLVTWFKGMAAVLPPPRMWPGG